MKFYICKHCKKMVAMVNEVQTDTVCCNEVMEELVPGAVEAAHEKHIPVVEVKENKVYVTVGSVAHPMQDVHYIEWIVAETNKGAKRRKLLPGESPEAIFTLEADETLLHVYAYCNLHGLWVK